MVELSLGWHRRATDRTDILVIGVRAHGSEAGQKRLGQARARCHMVGKA